jgi:hypothetical protein
LRKRREGGPAGLPHLACREPAGALPPSAEDAVRTGVDGIRMNRLIKMLSSLRRAKAERMRCEQQAQAATTYVARDGRGRVISSH